ncbi:hypothetical protein PMAC_000146 [Pneumocystis sp. 'macacae']|nr:hypothetical protein PMAC_000146 [Pneumocystis sp. 'macacae']
MFMCFVFFIIWRNTSFLVHFKPWFSNKKVLFLIAHPDDEVMFFGPSILQIKNDNEIYLVCLSTGNAEGLGEIRKKEFIKSCNILGILPQNIKIIENEFLNNIISSYKLTIISQLQDSMTSYWDSNLISQLLLEIIVEKNIDILVTFDNLGISKHPNHVACYYGAMSFFDSLEIRKVPVYVLTTSKVIAFSTAESYDFLNLKRALPENAIYLPKNGAFYLPKWSFDTHFHDIFIFLSGSFVTWGSIEKSEDFLNTIICNKLNKIEINPYNEYKKETFYYKIDKSTKTSISVQKDLIVIGNDFNHDKLLNSETPSPDNIIMAQLSFAQSLARSSKLAVLEDELENYLNNVKTIPDSLASGKIPLKRREIIQKTGILLRFRQYFNLNPENFLDLPEFYWENMKLEECYLKTNEALDMNLRLNIVNTKLNYATELQITLREVLSENTAHRLELIITCLIFIEVIFALGSYFDII